jgi:hypothetical protein
MLHTSGQGYRLVSEDEGYAVAFVIDLCRERGATVDIVQFVLQLVGVVCYFLSLATLVYFGVGSHAPA